MVGDDNHSSDTTAWRVFGGNEGNPDTPPIRAFLSQCSVCNLKKRKSSVGLSNLRNGSTFVPLALAHTFGVEEGMQVDQLESVENILPVVLRATLIVHLEFLVMVHDSMSQRFEAEMILSSAKC